MVTPLEKFLAKHPTPSGMSSKEWAALNAAMKENKFFSAKVENIRLLERLHRLIKDYLTGEKETLPNGETVIKVGSAADFSNQALQWLQTEGLVPPDAEGPEYHNNVKNIGALARLKLIFKTNVRQSMGAAQWEASMKPANLKAWPAFRFIRFPGAKTKRLVHVINEDAVRLKTDFTFWADEMNAASLGGFEVPWPPFGFNSYMDQEPVSRKECERLGLLKPGEPLKRPRGAERFGIDLIERYGYGKKASTAKLPEELKAKLKKVYEDRWGVKQDKPDEVVFPAKVVADKARKAEQMTFDLFKQERKDSAMAVIMKKAGLRPRGEATLEQVEAFMNALKTRHPERDWMREKFYKNPYESEGDISFKKISGEFSDSEKSTILENMNEFLRMVDPEVVEKLPKITNIWRAGEGEGRGWYRDNYKSPVIAYFSADESYKDTHFHEIVHWLHYNCGNDKKKKIGDYFQKRIKGEKYGLLKCRDEGYSDHFAMDFADSSGDHRKDDYAGKIYGFESGQGMPDGVEMPTRHLQKLACSPEEFLRYWNDRTHGKYYWRMAFLRCLTLLFK